MQTNTLEIFFPSNWELTKVLECLSAHLNFSTTKVTHLYRGHKNGQFWFQLAIMATVK